VFVDVVSRWEANGCPFQPGIAWRQDAWIEAFPQFRDELSELPAELDRPLVDQVIGDLDETTDGVTLAFVVSMAWGYGKVGYGPDRVQKTLSAPAVSGSLIQVTKIVRRDGASAGYRALASKWRVRGLGPAFGTKFLYFQSRSSPRPLILDRLIGKWFQEKVKISLTTGAWKPGSYDLYLKTMNEWSQGVGVDPETLEMIIFMDEADAAGGQWAT